MTKYQNCTEKKLEKAQQSNFDILNAILNFERRNNKFYGFDRNPIETGLAVQITKYQTEIIKMYEKNVC